MKTFVLMLGLLPVGTEGANLVQAATAKPTGAEARVSPQVPVAKAHGGKVWVQKDSFPATEGDTLRDWLAEHTAVAEVSRPGNDGPWAINYLAVFKKPAIKGPITVQFFEKGDAKSVVDQYSPPNEQAALVFQSSYELEPDHGFNKDRTYVIKVGQLLKGKFVPYASGEIKLK